MRVTEKGQVTIPKPIRDKLGIGPGSEVDFVVDGDELLLERRPVADARDDPALPLLRNVARHGGSFDLKGLGADEIYRLLRD